MQKTVISKPLFIVVFVIFIFNAILSIGNMIQDGASLRRVIPAICWSIASVGWIILYLKTRLRA